MGKRTKLILGIIAGAVIISSGTLFGLAKFGIIKTGILADAFGTKITVTVKYQNQSLASNVMVRLNSGSTVLETSATDDQGLIVFTSVNARTTYRVTTLYQEGCDTYADVTTRAEGSNTTQTLNLTCNPSGGGSGGATCGTQTCTSSQHCNTATNTCVDNCTSTSCPSGQTCNDRTHECQANSEYTLTGRILNLDGNPIEGATVSQSGKSATTGSDGRYNLTNLNTATQSSQSFNFHKNSYQPQTKTFTSIVHSTPPVTPTAFADDVRLAPDSSSFSLLGKITAAGETLLDGVQVKVSCLDDCGQGPWLSPALSSSAPLSTYPSLSRQYNYVVPNIYNFKNEPSISKLKVEFTKSGYFYDSNSDGINNDSSASIFIEKSSIVWTTVDASGPVAMNLSWKDVVLTRETNLTAVGRVAFEGAKDTLIPNLMVSINALDVNKKPVVFLGSTLTTTSNINTSYGFFANYKIENISPRYPFYQLSITDPNKHYEFALGQDSGKKIERIYSQSEILRNPDLHIIFNPVARYYYGDIFMGTVKDAETKNGVADAVIIIYDPVCGVIEQAPTSPDGVAFLRSSFREYHNAFGNPNYRGKYVNCIGPELIVRKPGYYKYIKNISSSSVKEEVFITHSPGSMDNSIAGKVVDKDDQPISDAQILLWKGTTPSPENSLPAPKTDSEGNFLIEGLTQSKYIVSAIKTDYRRDMESIYYFELFGSEQVYLNIKLIKPTPDQFVLGFLVLENEFLHPIGLNGMDCRIYSLDKSGTEYASCDINMEGMGQFTFTAGQRYRVDIEKDGKKLSREFVVPSNYRSLTRREQQNFHERNLVFLLDLQAKYDYIFPEITFKFIDSETKEPLEGVEVYTHWPVLSRGLSVGEGTMNHMFGFQDGITARSNSEGKIKYLSDFVSSIKSENSLKLLQYKKKYNMNEVFGTFTYSKPGYVTSYYDYDYSKRKSILDIPADQRPKCPWARRCELIIEMEKIVNGEGEIEACLNITPRTNQSNIDSVVSNVILEKQNPSNSWEAVSSTFKENISHQSCDAIMRYKNLKYGVYRIRVPNKSIVTEPVRISQNDPKQHVLLQTCANNPLYVLNYNSEIKLAFYSQFQLDLYRKNPALHKKIGDRISDLKTKFNNHQPIVISLNDSDEINAWAWSDQFDQCLGFKKADHIEITKGLVNAMMGTGIEWGIESVIIHEYAHVIYNGLTEKQTTFYRRWNNLWYDISSAGDTEAYNCIFNTIDDSTTEYMIRADGGHPYDNDSEMFASFTSGYIFNHDRLRDFIELNCSYMSPCQNTLAYMWTLYVEGFYTSQSSDKNFFSPIGSVLGPQYTFHQISNGHWRRSVYNNLGIIDKSKVFFSQMVSPYINKARSEVQKLVISFNNAIYKILEGLGLNQHTGSISGYVGKDSGPKLANMIVQIGPLAAITDQNGFYSITGLPVGGQPIVRVQHIGDGNAYQIDYPDDESFWIEEDENTDGNINVN